MVSFQDWGSEDFPRFDSYIVEKEEGSGMKSFFVC
jgi:hypothetical protein